MAALIVLFLALFCAVSEATDDYGSINPSAEYQEYHYTLPIKELHSHSAVQSYASKGKAQKQNVVTPEHLYGNGQVAAAVAAAQHAHAHAQQHSHYTKPGSAAVIEKSNQLAYTPVATPYAYNLEANHRPGIKPQKTAGIPKGRAVGFVEESAYGAQHGNGAGISKKPASTNLVDAVGAHGYLYGNYAPAAHGHYAPAVMAGYGFSGGYPGVGYRNHGGGYGQYGYGGFLYGGGYGGHGHGYGGLGYALQFCLCVFLVAVPPGYALGGITPHGGIGGGYGIGHGYGGVAGYTPIGGLGGYGHGLGGYGAGLSLGHHGGGYYGAYRR